ncbi:MAG: HlyD family efflux transporter periplasmic adaptor subunit [Proteobacteria bacterium]|nr:HlyD family efflux transporter periplasmic adaptor subunit [Pseudomonadota bacterium]
MTRHVRSTVVCVVLLALGACAKPVSDAAVSDAAPTAKPADMVAVARGRVDVEGGLLTLGAPRDGVVLEVNAKDGDHVKTGDTLLKLDPRAADLAVAAAKAEIDQEQAQAAVAAAKLPSLTAQAKRLSAAAHDGAATGQADTEARGALAVAQAEADSAIAAVEVARQHLAAAQYEREQMTLRAPVTGSVVARDVQAGERVTVASGKDLFRLLPDRPLLIHAELGEAFVNAVRPGMHAQVIPDADSRTVLEARVLRVGQVFGVARRSDDPQQSPDARVVDCVLALDGSSLRIGQQVLVRIPRQ